MRRSCNTREVVQAFSAFLHGECGRLFSGLDSLLYQSNLRDISALSVLPGAADVVQPLWGACVAHFKRFSSESQWVIFAQLDIYLHLKLSQYDMKHPCWLLVLQHVPCCLGDNSTTQTPLITDTVSGYQIPCVQLVLKCNHGVVSFMLSHETKTTHTHTTQYINVWLNPRCCSW